MTKGDGEAEGGRPAAEVTMLSSRDQPAGRSVLAELEDHWRELKAGSSLVPRRSDLDAGRMAGALPHAFILERAAPGVARFRIAGQAVTALLGGEPRGLPLSVLFAPDSRPDLQGWLERCFRGPALVDLMVQAPQGALRQPLRGRLLLLPLLDQEGEVTRALGGLLLDGLPRRSNLRLDLADAVPRIETEIPALPRRAFAQGPAAAPSGLREAERPYLRLVVSNPAKGPEGR